MNIKTGILTGYGINSDLELAWCFEKAGSETKRVHIEDLLTGRDRLEKYNILALPGGFSFGDHIASGKILANQLRFKLRESILSFIRSGKPVIGICNGFQILVKARLLPLPQERQGQPLTLTHNESRRFENRWVDLRFNPESPCIWTRGLDRLSLPVRHGEGRLVFRDEEIKSRLSLDNLAALYYADEWGEATEDYPSNPNGSPEGIAGITDPSGMIFGLMPHPEAARTRHNIPGWQAGSSAASEWVRGQLQKDDGPGMAFFYNAVNHVRQRYSVISG